MRWTPVLLVVPLLIGQAPAGDGTAAPQTKARRDQLAKLFLQEAAQYTIFRDSARSERVELNREPVYVWTNPLRGGGGQDGAVFVWTCRGRAEVVGTFFSSPTAVPVNLNHEFHSLALSTLDVTRTGGGGHTWTPQAPGIELTPLTDAPAPARTPNLRLAQMRTLTRDFTVTTQDDKETRWELRILPRPLYRYESTDPAVLDGAVFAFVTSAGTDPEACSSSRPVDRSPRPSRFGRTGSAGSPT